MNWEQVGWKVEVDYRPLPVAHSAVDNMATLRPLLPDRYSPLSPDGRGSQSVYLTEVPAPMAQALAGLIGHAGTASDRNWYDVRADAGLSDRPAQSIAEWEEHLRSIIEKDVAIPETTREQLVLARRGQGDSARTSHASRRTAASPA